MKNIKIYASSLILMLSGCFTVMPEINNAFIKNRSDGEKSDLAKIQNEIISINKEIRELEKNSEITKQKQSAIRKKLTLLDYQRPYLEEMVKLYILMEESEKLGKSRGELAASVDEYKFNSELSAYFNVNVDYQNARVETKQAELSVKIAEQELEKAYIISKGSAGQPVDAGKDTKPVQKYRDVPCTQLSKGVDVNVCKIMEHYADRQKNLVNKKQDLEAVSLKFLEAEKNIKKYNKNYEF